MIGKIPKAGRGFKGLVSYLLHDKTNGRTDQRQNAKHNRVPWTKTHNLITDNPAKAVSIMRATANRSRRCKSPVYHFVISWTREENPSPALMRSIADTASHDMGLSEHQRIVIAHDDTAHKHLHVVVNRIHPETGKAWNRRQDWPRLENALARLAKQHGLLLVPGCHNDPALFKTKPRRAPDPEIQMARRQKQREPALKWTITRIAAERQTLAAIFDHAQGWNELAAELSVFGLTLHAKGQGLVLRDDTSELKLSQIAKHLRRKTLETRFRQPFTQNPAAITGKKPPQIDHSARPTDNIPFHPQLTAPQQQHSPPTHIDASKLLREHNPIDNKVELFQPETQTPFRPEKRRRKKGPRR